MNEIKTFILETNSSCNLNCDYCYSDKNEEILKEETVDEFIDQCKESNLDKVTLLWMGGESLLRSTDFYKNVFNKIDDSKIEAENRIQTNGTLIDQEWIELFDEYDIEPGVSIDGPSDMHNLKRKYMNDETSFEEIIENIEFMKENNINPGGISVVTRDTLGKEEELYNFFKEMDMDASFNVIETDDQKKQLTQEEYFKFHKRMYDIWSNDENRTIQITPLKEITKSFFGSPLRMCTFTDCSDNCISVVGEGDSYLCGKFNRMEDYKLGEITDGIGNLYQKKKEITNSNHNNINHELLGCHYMNLMVNDDINDPAYREARKELFDYISKDLKDRI